MTTIKVEENNIPENFILPILPIKVRAPYGIEDITILQPNKVMRVKVSFYGRMHRDIICVVNEPDVFDMERGLYIALAKYAYGDCYTIKGIEYKATEFSYQKVYVKEVRRAIKAYQKKIKAEEENKKKELEEKQRMAAKKAKMKAKKEARKTRRQMDLAEAILLANQLEEQQKQLRTIQTDATKAKKATDATIAKDDRVDNSLPLEAKTAVDNEPKTFNFTVTLE